MLRIAILIAAVTSDLGWMIFCYLTIAQTDWCRSRAPWMLNYEDAMFYVFLGLGAIGSIAAIVAGVLVF